MLSNEIETTARGQITPPTFLKWKKLKEKKLQLEPVIYLSLFFPFELKLFSKSFLKPLKTWWTYICHLVTMVTDTYSHTFDTGLYQHVVRAY